MLTRPRLRQLLARFVTRGKNCRPTVALRLEALEDRTVPTLLGQQLYPSDNPWNQVVTNAPVAANSAAVLNNLLSHYGDGRLHPDFGQDYHAGNPLYGIPYNVVHGNSTTKTSVVIDAYASESDVLAAPIPANAVIEGDFDNGPNPTLGYGPGGRGDSHLLVYDVDNNVAYEFFKASRPSENADGRWHADQETVWDYKTNAFRTLGATSADAAGLSILAGLVRPDESLPVSQGGQGVIKHAIRVTLENSLVLNEFLYPASHNANPGNTDATVLVPMGARFRLKASVDLSQLDPQSRIVAQAMKDYGLILADNGSNFFFSGASYAVDGSNAQTLTWNDEVQDSTRGLKSLHYSDFELLDLTPVVTGLSTPSGGAGTSVTVTGKNFSGAAEHLQVLFGTTPATSVSVVDDGHVVAVAPPGSGTVDVRVRSGVVTGANGSNFTSPIFGYGTSAVTAADRFSYGAPPPGNQPPTVAQAAATSPATVTGKTTGLSVLGADDGGESNLRYTWSSSGPATASFSANNTNAAKNVTATFAKAGQYTFVVTITDAGGLSVTSSVSVTASQTLTSITVTPTTATVAPGQRQQFTATALDQFGAALSSQPSFTWAASGGTIASGLFTAGATAGGPFTVTATKSGVSGTANVTVSSSTPPPPPPPPPPAPRQRVLVLGTDAGTAARVQVLDATTRQVIREFSPFAGFSGGVRVAAGDVNGDGVPDVIAGAGSGGGSQVQVFDGATGATLFSFVAFAGFNGPVSVALGDVTGDGRADLIVGAPVNGHVKAFDGATGATFRSFLSFEGFSGSVAVGAGDLNGDGRAELIVGAAQNGHVKAFSAIDNALVQSFLAYAGFSGSTTVAGGDLDGDGRAEIITGAGAAATHVKAFDGVSRAEEASFIAFPGAPYGVRVGAADVNGDGKDDVLAAPGGPVPQVKLFDGATLHEIDSFFALAATGGVGVFLGGSR